MRTEIWLWNKYFNIPQSKIKRGWWVGVFSFTYKKISIMLVFHYTESLFFQVGIAYILSYIEILNKNISMWEDW